jgi:hypothetical protein
MPDRNIDADTYTSFETGKANVDRERGIDPRSVCNKETQEKLELEGERVSQQTARVVWRKPSIALVDFGVCPSWCGLVSRGPSASISRFGLRTAGLATWVFARPRRALTSCGVAHSTACGGYTRHSRR